MFEKSIYRQQWYAEKYDKDRFGGSFGEYLHDLEVNTYLSMINESQGMMLDVGAGTGKLTLPIMERSREVISLDASLEMLQIAKGKLKKENIVLKSVICDAEHLCFRDETFDCVVSSRLLMHLKGWREGLGELCRVTKRSLVLDFPPLEGFSGVESLFKRFVKYIKPGVRAYKAYPIRSVIGELERNGYRVVSMKRLFVLPVAFHRWLNRPCLSSEIEQCLSRIGLLSIIGAPVTVKALKVRRGNIE